MMEPPTLEYAAPPAPALRRANRLTAKWIAPLAGLVIVAVLFGFLSDDFSFLTLRNFKFIAAQTVVVGISAVGMTFIMIGGGIDLSVGSVMALCCVALARFLQIEVPVALAVLGAVLVGGLCGLTNGVIITGLRVVPFVVTLGMLGIARGLARAVADNRIVRLDEHPEGLANFMRPLQSDAWWDFAPAVWLLIAVTVVSGVILSATRFGRHTFAIGDNETAARFSGIRVHQQKWWLYAIGGMLTGVSGVMLFANITQGDPSAAVGMELQVIAAVVIGGGSLMGGEGTVFGTLLGALMLTALVNGCTHAGWENWVQEIIIGAIIILAVALDYLRQRVGSSK